jgi:hypothetical protein
MHPRSLILFSVLSLAGVACAADADDASSAPSTEESNVNSAAPITMANWVSHPSIKAIRTEVSGIDGSQLAKAENPGCDGGNTKFTDGEGRIRKLVEVGGEGGFEGTTTAYYDASGKLRFILDQETDHTGASPRTTEKRIYFGADGKVLWQVVRDQGGADREPRAEEKYQANATHADPAAWFAYTGCGQ